MLPPKVPNFFNTDTPLGIWLRFVNRTRFRRKSPRCFFGLDASAAAAGVVVLSRSSPLYRQTTTTVLLLLMQRWYHHATVSTDERWDSSIRVLVIVVTVYPRNINDHQDSIGCLVQESLINASVTVDGRGGGGGGGSGGGDGFSYRIQDIVSQMPLINKPRIFIRWPQLSFITDRNWNWKREEKRRGKAISD